MPYLFDFYLYSKVIEPLVAECCKTFGMVYTILTHIMAEKYYGKEVDR